MEKLAHCGQPGRLLVVSYNNIQELWLFENSLHNSASSSLRRNSLSSPNTPGSKVEACSGELKALEGRSWHFQISAIIFSTNSSWHLLRLLSERASKMCSEPELVLGMRIGCKLPRLNQRPTAMIHFSRLRCAHSPRISADTVETMNVFCSSFFCIGVGTESRSNFPVSSVDPGTVNHVAVANQVYRAADSYTPERSLG